jgi:hypothetical protein
MMLGGRSWLNAIARDADGAYGMSHGLLGLQSQSWYAPPGQGVKTCWEGETVYQTAHPDFEFSAWVDLPDPPLAAYAYLQLYYGGAWHQFVTDSNAGAHWFDLVNCVDGVISNDISGLYSDGEVVRAKLITNGDGVSGVTSAFIYRALLTGTTGFLTWPTWPAWTTATPHTATEFNTLRTAAMYLKDCNERPWLGSESGIASHAQEAYEEVLRWTFKLGGAQNLHMEINTSNCTAAPPPDVSKVYVSIQEEQFPHGPSGGAGTWNLATYTSDGAQTLDADLSGYTVGTRYCICVAVEHGVADPSPSADVARIYLNDLAGVTRTTALGEFVYGDQTPATGDGSIDEIADDLEAMKPAVLKASPSWYDHEFVVLRGHDRGAEDGVGLAELLGRRWVITHIYPYLRWRGAGRIASLTTDAAGVPDYSCNLAYTKTDQTVMEDPGGDTGEREAQVFELKALNWLAHGDAYSVADDGADTLLTAYEDWQA